MKVIDTPLKSCKVIQPDVFHDDRGYFSVVHDLASFKEQVANIDFIAQNESKSTYGVIRGLHAQQGDHAQAKLVRCVQGEILDVVVDHRPESATYLKHYTRILSDHNHEQLFVPRGFLHGFAVLSPTAIVQYQIDNPYRPEHEYGVKYDDPTFQIDWQIPQAAIQLSKKDENLGYL